MTARDPATLLREATEHRAAGRFADAVACYHAVLTLHPDRAELHHALGDALAAMHRPNQAIDCYRAALALKPGLGETWNNLGRVLLQQNRRDDALGCFRRAVDLLPNVAAVYNNLGTALRAIWRLVAAIAAYRAAAALQPDFPEAHYNLGEALARLRRHEEAIASLTKALELRPDYTSAFAERADQRWHLCDWDERDAECARLIALVQEGTVVAPFLLRAAGASAADMLAAARLISRQVKRPGTSFTHPPRPRRERLRIGYLSSDFHGHPIGRLLAELIERHDRAAVVPFAYSHGPDDGSPTRQRLARAFDHFVDLAHASDADAARRIHADGIDILVDLNGFTVGRRPAILAARPAPVQASWLGYIGTSGSYFLDYVIADRFAVSEDQQPYYDERIMHLRYCYLPLDTTREIPEPTPPRAAFGLPETGFVFCCFNNNYKLTPAMFDVWMRILARVPGSVLWLLAASPPVVANLQREAASRGTTPERLVFAPSIPLQDYLARFRRADLFLDTLPCGACTTGTDALWAGLPLLTCAGEIFAGRHAGSLLLGAGLPELVTRTLADYEEMAVHLATAPGLLAGLRQRLQRRAAPLFDTDRFARDLEALYRRMADRYAADAPLAALPP